MKKVTFVRNRITAGGVPIGKGYRIKSMSEILSIHVARDRANVELEVGDEISLGEIQVWKSYNHNVDVVMVEK